MRNSIGAKIDHCGRPEVPGNGYEVRLSAYDWLGNYSSSVGCIYPNLQSLKAFSLEGHEALDQML